MSFSKIKRKTNFGLLMYARVCIFINTSEGIGGREVKDLLLCTQYLLYGNSCTGNLKHKTQLRSIKFEVNP